MEQRKNDSFVPSITQLEHFLTEHDSNVVWLLVATILSCGWIIYLTYYNSRNVGLILTLVLNRLYKHGYIHIGSFSFSVLSGKVMVREIYYITEDMSIRIQDGFIIFRWWKMYNPKQKQHDPKAETRLYIMVNDFEFHVYNRSALYGQLQELFGLDPTIIPPRKEDEKAQENGRDTTHSDLESVKVKTESQDPSSSWRSLIPVIKVNVSTGRLAFGNHYQPQTLCINFDDAFLTYTTKPPSSHLDHFMHILKGKLENVRVMLVPSPRYVGLQTDEPPRLMGEGFVVMQSNDVDIYYYMDEPGLVPEETEENNDGETSDEDSKLQDLPPCWGLDIVCGKGTDFNYGPWADRQRDCLWKFFFPPDYQVMKVSEIAQPGKPRQILAFELRMNIIADATIDLLFTKNRETNAVHVNVGAGSYLEINIPMTVSENGYSPAIKGQLLHVDATSSMQYRTLLEAEMLAFHINANYPRIWNMPQTWQCEVEVYKATYHFIFAQKNFFADLIQDWSSDSAPDIFSFVPYIWNFKVMFHQFEMIWAANQHNWIDCSTKQQENVYLAACGETLNIIFSLPFTDFVPTTCSTRFSLRGEDVDLHLFLPDCHPSKYSLFMLVKDCHPNKISPESCISAECQSGQKTGKPKWRNITQEEAGWVECWTVPSVTFTIDYTWHPIYPQKADEQLKQSLSEMEETMLSVLRPSQKTADRIISSPTDSTRLPIDPSELPPDKLHVELEVSPDSQITLYGPLLNAFLFIKENYFGEDDMYTDFEEVISSPVLSMSTSSSSGWTAVGLENDKKGTESSAKPVHPLTLRPWDITVLVNVYKVHGRLPVHGSTDGPECPTAFLERLCFEMKKGFRETMLQLVLSPLNLFLNDSYQRPSVDELLREGHISLSGLQLRAHAMFSAEGLPVGSDTLEYAWLIDVQAGCLTAKVTAPQLACLLEWGQMFVFHVMCREFELERPKSVIMCQHGIDRRFCESKMNCVPGPCPTSDDLKYTMTRLAIDGADLYIVEHGCATNIKMGAVRIANCNLHNQFVGEGISAAIQDFQLRQYVEQVNNCRVGLQPAILRRAYWLEAGSVNLGLITADIALAGDHHSKHEVQRHFLETHDSRIKRLWFLWPDDNVKNKRSKNKCGCLGGCRFFGGTVTGLDFFKLEEMTPSSSSAFSSTSAESDMFYGQSLLQPGEWIITKEIPKIIDSKTNGVKRKDWDCRSVGIEIERKAQHLSLQVPLRSHSSSSSSEENSSSSAALPLLAGEKESPSSTTEDHMGQKEFVSDAKREDGHGSTPAEVSGTSPVSPNNQERSVGQSPLRSPLKRQASVCSTRLGSTKSLTAAFYGDKQPVPVGVQFSSDVSRSDENVLDSPKQRRSFGSFPYTPSADSNSFHQYRSMDSSMSMADSEAYFSAAEEFEPISSDEGPGTYPGRKKRKKQAQQIEYSRGSIYHSVEGPLTSTVHGEASQDPKTLPIKTHASQASFVSAVGGEDELVEHMYIMEAEKAVESDQITSQQPIMTCYQSYLTQFQVVNWSVKHPTNKRTSKSSLHRPLDLDTPTSEESSSSFEHFSVPTFKIVKQGLTANALLDRGMQLTGSTSNTPYTPLEKKTMDNTDDETITEEWTLDHPVSQTRTTAIVEVKGTVDVVLTPLVAEALDRYIEAMVHCASTQHPAAIVDDLHYKVLREAVQNSKTTFSENLSSKQDVRGTKTENPATGTTNQGQAQTNLSLKQDNVKIKGLQANVTIPKVNLCLLQASVEETSGIASGKTVTHVSLVALCFDRIATQVRMNRGVIEETSNNADTGRNSVTFDRYIHASKMQPQSSGSLRSNTGAEKGKEIAAKLNIHRVHGQLRGLDATDIGTCAITAIPFEKSKVLFTLEELDEFTFVDETDQQAVPDVTRIGPSQERWGWIMFECGIENLTIKGGRQSGAVLYSTFGVMGKSNATERGGLLASNNSSDSPTGSGYNTDVSDDNLPCDRSPSSDINGNSVSDEQDEGVESDDLKKDLPLMPPPPDSCSMKLTIKEIWFSFAAPTNVRSPAHKFSRQLNLLSTATPAVGAWLVPIDQLKSSLNRLETEGTLRICAVMGCIMTEALENKSMHFPLRSKYNRLTKVARFLQENPSCLLCNILHHYLHQANYSIIEDATMSDGLPALVTLKKGLVALARQWMKFIVVTPAFKGVSLHRPAQPLKPQTTAHPEHEDGVGLDNGGGLQSDTSADGAEFEFDAATVSEHTMLLEGTANRPPPAGVSSGPVTGAEIMRKLSKTHTHSDSALKIKGIHPYQSLSYTSGDTATDSPVHVGRSGMPVKESPRKESLLSYLTGSFPSLHNLLEGTPQRSTTAVKSSSLTRTGNTVATDMLSEHPLLSEPSSVSFYNWMSNAVGNRGGVVQESPNTKSGHNSLPTGIVNYDWTSKILHSYQFSLSYAIPCILVLVFVRTVVKCSIAKSQALYSAQRGLKTNNAAVLKVGAISINIPQHPATLHSMMVRSSHQLSKQISDLIRQPSTAPQPAKEDVATPLPSEKTPTSVNQTPVETNEFPQLPEGLEKKPIVLKFSAMIDGIAIGAALLPSLKAEYKMGRMRSHGMTGAQTRFTFELPNHRLRFTSKVSATDMSTIPPSASLNLPPVTMSGKYVMEEHDTYSDQIWSIDELPTKQGYYLQGNYLRCVAEVGSFEHNLTTDLLNHLVFVQKVFMKEVNEVIQKVSGGEQPIPLWNEHDGTTDGEKPKILLYSLSLQFKGIQVTATTPSMRAVRFETGLIELELSNRIQTKAMPGSTSYLKLFGKCQVDLNLALGQIVKHQVYEEAGSDFHQVAYFKTRIGLRNALREEISGSSDREAVLITLNRPIVFAQPVAFDRAVLFWLNYKAAYDNWNEQRLALHKDIHMATKEVVDMLPGIQQTSAQAFGTLFLQLTVNDLGICLPITNAPQSNHTADLDTGSALVLTIESTLITACSSESLVSKGHFKNFCIRFADGFETSWDDWKPEIRGDLVMNACVVPDGTYEVCSRTAGQAAAESNSAGTWTLNVLWKMCGIDVHMDPNIGKRLNALGNTLTTLTGEEDVDDIADLNSVNIADLSDEDEVDTMSPTIHAETVDYRRQGASGSQVGEQRGRKFVKRLVDIRELNEQAKVIDDLKKLGASEGTINQEIQRYQQLESVAVNDIRRDVRKKLRRSSMRAASLKDKWGLGYKPSYNRSKTISASGRPPLKRMDRASSRLGDSEELPEIRVDAASPGPRVTFNIQDPFPEETELDLLSVTIDGPSHYSSTSEGSCSVFSSPKTPVVFSPSIPFQPEEGRRDDSLSSTSEDSEKEEDHDREKAYFYRKPQNTTRKKATGFAAVHQLFTDRWPTTPGNRNVTGTTTERNIDFELDIRVEIDCGKCVLHPTTLQQEHDEISLRRSYDRSSRSLDQESPSKKKKFQTNYASTTHLLAGKKVPSSLQTKPSDLETTVFYIPGVDVKLHYNSKTLKTESPNASRGSSLPRTLSKESKLYGMKDTATSPLSNTTHSKTNTLLLPQPPPIPSAKGKGSGGIKTAKLYAWVALQSLPEEMVISPCLLDFLEKALETIPITPIERNYAAVSSQDEDMGQFEIQDALEESTASLVSSSTSAYSSFPVDVVVYVRVQPSQIKFSCLPVSRVECMLKLPSLDLVFSSNRGELETLGTTCPTENLAVGGNTSQTGSKNSVNKTGIPGSSGLGSPLGRTRHSSSQSDLTSSSSNSSGLSFTACMSDFSLYVFHPYGAGKQKSAVTGLTPGSGALGNVDEEPTSVTGRKDSLSINLEFVKVSLSRIRRSGGASFFESQSASKAASKMDTTLINISAVCDIGSASFKYDMRRLSEILAFPRAWYRRSIARRLFLGDQTINLPASGPGTPDSIDGVSQHLSPESSRKAYCRTWEQPCQSASFTHMAQSPNVFNEHNTNTSMSPGTANHNLKSPAVARSRSVSDSSVPHRDTLSKTSTPFNKSNKAGSQQGTPWETLVVFAMNLKQLNVQMNMSNVMGNTTWTTSGLKSQGRLSVGSNRDREISMSVGLGRSQLDSRGGVVGGTIDVNTLEMVAHISEHPNQQPSHKIQITMGSTEARVDYMGSSILMGIFSNADLKLQDEWKVNLYNTLDSSISDKSEIFVHGDLKWDIFQVMISRSTTPDLIKIGMKLQEFFTQQFDTSKRALSTWGPVPYLPPKTVANIEKSSHEQLLDAAHHRHWPGVLKVVSGGHISLFQVPLPEDGMQFGGSMSLHGNHMTLACFHGPNFRSKSWALFHLEEPNIAFWTEAQKIWEDGSSEHSTYVVQTLDFHLGHNTMVTKPCGALESPMATITKITRRRHENPPHGVASVKEWFNYVTATRNEELNLLRNVDANNTESSTTVKNSSLLSGFRGGSSYNHETETIFALPRMQLDFKSIHVQEPQEPSLQDTSVKPTVECSVVTEFTDHICVTMDAELIMFLHDLVSAYLKEKEKAIFPPRILSTRPGQKSPVSLLDESSSERDAEESITYTTVDWREFMCNTWHLEPTLRLISWTGRKIDPVGVDYILQKLGFHHARTTIPKWLQRGVMDPLDKVLSVLIKKLGTALQDEKEKKGKDKEEH
ncbi:transmembrane protein KIAA1109 homolog [Trachemys scripta elegans]|uniref:transmembrane protein KIAA1109 homolog n=1 Tax=Trachemys scripta elegans TaxID=31138 RepID=UPI001552A10E|nr:transmembrane protein KIAA1109 homolog [Trachemys scripta elegans]